MFGSSKMKKLRSGSEGEASVHIGNDSGKDADEMRGGKSFAGEHRKIGC